MPRTWFIHPVAYDTTPVVMIEIDCFADINFAITTMTLCNVHMI